MNCECPAQGTAVKWTCNKYLLKKRKGGKIQSKRREGVATLFLLCRNPRQTSHSSPAGCPGEGHRESCFHAPTF